MLAKLIHKVRKDKELVGIFVYYVFITVDVETGEPKSAITPANVAECGASPGRATCRDRGGVGGSGSGQCGSRKNLAKS